MIKDLRENLEFVGVIVVVVLAVHYLLKWTRGKGLK